MSREVCGICWCPYDEFTGECACAPQSLPAQEPVAWMYDCGGGGRMYAEELDDVPGWAPLYTAPPQRKPLSEDEVLDIARTFGAQPWPPGSCVAFARAIERAHGIGEHQ